MYTKNSNKDTKMILSIGIVTLILVLSMTVFNMVSKFKLKASTPDSELTEKSQTIITKELKNLISAEIVGEELINYFKNDEPLMKFISAHKIKEKPSEPVKKKKVENKVKKGYITAYVLNVREKPSIKSKIVGNFKKNDKVKYMKHNNDWYIVEYDEALCFISSAYITNKKPTTVVANTEIKTEEVVDNKTGDGVIKYAPKDSRKSYMDFRTITSRNSPQYKLQYGYAKTASNGIRTVNGRYCVALGSYFTHEVGRYVDLYLANGTVLPCIIGDCKQDAHTMKNHSIGIDGGVSEFIVHTGTLSRRVKLMGDVSYVHDSWNSPVVKIKVYKTNVFKK